MDGAHLPPLPFLLEQQAVQCQASQMDFLIHLFVGTSVKLQPKAYLDAGAASDACLSRPGKTKDIRKAPIMRCQAGQRVIVNYIYPCAAGMPPPCFQEYKAASSNMNESASSVMKFNKWESGLLLRPYAWTFEGTLQASSSAEFCGHTVAARLLALALAGGSPHVLIDRLSDLCGGASPLLELVQLGPLTYVSN